MRAFLFKYLTPYRRLIQARAALRYLERGTSAGFEYPVCAVCGRSVNEAGWLYGLKGEARCPDHVLTQGQPLRVAK